MSTPVHKPLLLFEKDEVDEASTTFHHSWNSALNLLEKSFSS